MAISEGRRGYNSGASGVTDPLRLNKWGSVVTDQGGKYSDGAIRGETFHAQTVAAGVAPGTALGTTAAFALWNPPASGKNLVILKAFLSYVSGTIGVGTLFYTAAPQAGLAPSGTAITIVPALILGSATPVALAKTTATVVTPTQIKAAFNLFPFLASTVLGAQPFVDVVDGDIVVGEGGCLALHAIAGAGTSPLVQIGVTWQEVPTGY